MRTLAELQIEVELGFFVYSTNGGFVRRYSDGYRFVFHWYEEWYPSFDELCKALGTTHDPVWTMLAPGEVSA